ncbi:hypothetical protein JHK86_023617 [Glycine max]|nr:hypothetical protein JHK86_023617 [Glycine max]
MLKLIYALTVVRNFMQCIGATTLDEYRKHIEKDPALERRFQPDETIQILKGLRERYEIHHKLRYTDVQLSHLNVLLPFRDRFLSDKAIDLIDEAGRLSSPSFNRHRYLSTYPDLLSIIGLILLDLHASSYLKKQFQAIVATSYPCPPCHCDCSLQPLLTLPKEVSTPVPKFTRELSTQSSDFNILSS